MTSRVQLPKSKRQFSVPRPSLKRLANLVEGGKGAKYEVSFLKAISQTGTEGATGRGAGEDSAAPAIEDGTPDAGGPVSAPDSTSACVGGGPEETGTTGAVGATDAGAGENSAAPDAGGPDGAPDGTSACVAGGPEETGAHERVRRGLGGAEGDDATTSRSPEASDSRSESAESGTSDGT